MFSLTFYGKPAVVAMFLIVGDPLRWMQHISPSHLPHFN